MKLSLDIPGARRLALARAGLLKPAWTDLPARGARQPAAAAQAHIERTGYLQLDSVSVTGARSHGIVLLSRLEGLPPERAEALLAPGGDLFEYWGHEACWMPLSLYPAFAWRRDAFRSHPWWGDLVGAHPERADALLARIRDEGPLRSADLEGQGGQGWWRHKLSKKIAEALWSSGELAIRERSGFLRSYDLAERVIPERWRGGLPREAAWRALCLKALEGHGWASERTVAATWRLPDRAGVRAALRALQEAGEVAACELVTPEGRRRGWIRPADLELAERLRPLRPRRDRGVLLSPFDPVLWDRERVRRLFNFELKLEIYTPAPQRRWGYYCLPVLAGDALVGRVDLKAHRKAGALEVRARHLEPGAPPSAVAATDHALARFADALSLSLSAPSAA
jgi:uncharacterized protein YcaQ